MTACVLRAGAAGRHVPRRRGLGRLPVPRPGVRWLARRLDLRCAVSDDARGAGRALPRRHLRAALQRHRGRAASPRPSRSRPTGPTILFLGRHEERKGLEVLLDGAWPSLPADVRVWVGGDGPQSAELRASARPATRGSSGSAGSTTTRSGRRLRGADVFCAPSLRGESFGVVLLEAMAAGAAIVARTCRATASGPDRRRTRLLVPPGDAGALAAALRRVLDDPDRAGRLVAVGRASGPQQLLDGPPRRPLRRALRRVWPPCRRRRRGGAGRTTGPAGSQARGQSPVIVAHRPDRADRASS